MDGLSEEILHGLAGTHTFQRFTARLLDHIEEVNTTCLDTMVATARNASSSASAFAIAVCPPLLSASTAVRRRAAQQRLPLAEMEFRNDAWWRAVKSDPQRVWGTAEPTIDPPRRAALRLARTTLILAWQGLNADRDVTRVLFSMSTTVAQTIAEMRFSEIESVAEYQCRHVRPRWEDRPWLWVSLLKAAASNDQGAMRQFHIHALQLLTGESLPKSQ
jgi:hypothetical protein